MDRIIEGGLTGDGFQVAVVVSRFNEPVTSGLLRGAIDCLERHRCPEEQRTIIRVPGAWEIPLAARKLAVSKRYDAIVALGALIRGATPHFDVLATQVASGLASISADSGVPVAFGVLTTDTVEQAMDRSGVKFGNKGWEAAISVLEMANLYRRMES